MTMKKKGIWRRRKDEGMIRRNNDDEYENDLPTARKHIDQRNLQQRNNAFDYQARTPKRGIRHQKSQDSPIIDSSDDEGDEGGRNQKDGTEFPEKVKYLQQNVLRDREAIY